MITGGRRSRRLQRHQEKARRWPVLNLVPLMDVFTILVFFFLVHSVDVALSADRGVIELPESIAERRPRETPVVMITREAILLQGAPVMSAAAANNAAGRTLASLQEALERQLVHGRIQSAQDDRVADLEIMIMGDKSIPFALLQKVMLTCTRAGFGQISLSVIQRPLRPG